MPQPVSTKYEFASDTWYLVILLALGEDRIWGNWWLPHIEDYLDFQKPKKKKLTQREIVESYEAG